MKKKLNYLLLSLLMCVMSSSMCDPDPEPSTLSVSTASINLTAAGGSQALSVSSNTNWAISGGESWLTVSPSSGSGNTSINLSATENKDFESRNCTLTFSTIDGDASASVTVSQEGNEVTLTVNVNELNFSEKEDDLQQLTITSNSDWRITGKPEWLDLSSSSGSGTSTINLTTNSFNNSPDIREATLTISANGISKEVKIKQKAGLASDCDAKFGTVAILYNSVSFDLELGNNISSFGWDWLPKSKAGILTDNQIIDILGSDIFRRFTPENDGDKIFLNQSFEPETEYIIYTLAYDKNGNRGNLVKKEIKTKKKVNAPYVEIYNVEQLTNYFHWWTRESSNCDKYYMLYWRGNDLNSELPFYNWPDAAIAWVMMNSLNSLETKLNDDDYYLSRADGDNYLQIVTWGVYESGELSGRLNNYPKDFRNSSNSKMTEYMQNKAPEKMSIKKSDLLKNARFYQLK